MTTTRRVPKAPNQPVGAMSLSRIASSSSTSSGSIAALLVRTVRESLVQPILTTMVMLRFHTMVENQPLDGSWVERLRSAGDGLGRLDDLRRRAS